jgi:DUF4097 and DUF4098 domain-containing protein YvlB
MFEGRTASMSEETIRILRLLEEGKITAPEAESLLRALRREKLEEEPVVLQQEPRPHRRIIGRHAGRTMRPHRIMAEVMREVNPGQIVAQVLSSVRDHISEDLASAGIGPHAVETPEEFSVDPEGIKRISLVNFRGDVEVTGASQGPIVVRARKKSWGPELELAQDRAESIKVTHTRLDETLNIRVEGGPWLKKRHSRVDFSLSLPAAIDLEISDTAGDIDISGMQSDLSLKTTSGDIAVSGSSGGAVISSMQGEVSVEDFSGGLLKVEAVHGDIEARKVKGTIELKTVSGDISLEEASGTIELKSMNADLSLESVSGDIVVNTVSGDIEIEGGSGTVQAQASNGDIEIGGFTAEMLKIATTSGDIAADVVPTEQAEIQLRTTHGDIDLDIPEDSKATIEMETQSGDVSCDLPLTDAQETGRSVKGVLNAPGATIVMQSNHGDLALSGK